MASDERLLKILISRHPLIVVDVSLMKKIEEEKRRIAEAEDRAKNVLFYQRKQRAAESKLQKQRELEQKSMQTYPPLVLVFVFRPSSLMLSCNFDCDPPHSLLLILVLSCNARSRHS